jgi:hypothetical protein
VQCKTKVIPVIIGAYLSNKPGRYKIDEGRETAILSTAHILQKVLM